MLPVDFEQFSIKDNYGAAYAIDGLTGNSLRSPWTSGRAEPNRFNGVDYKPCRTFTSTVEVAGNFAIHDSIVDSCRRMWETPVVTD